MSDDPTVTIVIQEAETEEPPADTQLVERTTTPPPPPAHLPTLSEFERVSIDFVCKQRDEALTRVVELEALLNGYEDMAADNERMREMLRRISVLAGGCHEFESLEQLITRKMALLDSMMQEEVRAGIREAARNAELSETGKRMRLLEEQVARLKSQR